MKNRIAIIIPYFGRFPEWFDMYLYSCSRNPFITYYFFTDCDIPDQIYPNTRFTHLTFKEYCNVVSESLNIQFEPDSPYKLCDLKPFYGVIHSDELKEYDFWGFGDIDLVYGDLSVICNDEILDRYDVISTHHDRLSGHFAIFRKASKYTNYCFRINNWKERLSSNCHYGLDEVDMTKLIYPELRMISICYRRLFSFLGVEEWSFREWINKVVRRIGRRYFKEYKTTVLPKEGEVWKYYVNDNSVVDPVGLELPYLHFMFFKKTQYADTEQYWRDGFWGIPSGFDYSEYDGEIFIDNKGITLSK